MSNYHKAYKEVLEILKYIPEEDRNKIPRDLISMFERNMDKTYKYNIDENANFENQKILRETEAILGNIYIEYWATPEQKESIQNKYKQQMIEIEKNKKIYEPNSLFKNKEKAITTEIINYKERWHTKFINLIKRIFKKGDINDKGRY